MLLRGLLHAVGKDSKPGTVAGALAARVREQKNVSLVAIGVDAVANAVVRASSEPRTDCETRLCGSHLSLEPRPSLGQGFFVARCS